MKIKIEKKPFWLWLLVFCYRRLKESRPELPVGIPEMRDPENPCTSYAPRKRTAGDHRAFCGSDGHYLCKGCMFYNPEEDLTRNETN